MNPMQALQALFEIAIQARNLPPAAYPEIQQLVNVIKDALDQTSDQVRELQKEFDAIKSAHEENSEGSPQ